VSSRRDSVLVVDDEVFVRESLRDLLENEGYRVIEASTVREAVQTLESESPGAIVTDLRMPREGGLVLLQEARKLGVEAPIVVLTGVGTVSEAVEAMKSGAYDFIQKPFEPEQFILLIKRALEHGSLVSEIRYLRSAVEDLRGPSDMVGTSDALGVVRAHVAQVAPTDATVLITGESGTGKELVASEVHRKSGRRKRNLVRVNCAAISESLFESEFFGHRRGSFTSAIADRMGRFAEAEGGTLVLDEIGTLRPEMQAKLLRVLETGEYQVIGESRTRIADVRVIAITNEDLPQRVREGAFRRDLYYRLAVFPIEVPPLRRRPADVPLLARHFLARARAAGRTPAVSDEGELITPEAIEALAAYGWPGNVRELRNVMERAWILSAGRSVDAPLIHSILSASRMEESDEEAGAGDLHIRRRVDALERKLIADALARSGGKRREAAALLGIDPKNMGYYLRKHGMMEGPGSAEEPS